MSARSQNPRPSRDPVLWRDLTRLGRRDMWIENTLPLPWLLLSWALAHHGYYVLALPCSAFFFLTTLRQVHGGFHLHLGLSPRATALNLFLNSMLMCSSMHAIKFNHLRHHRYNLLPDDYEGRAAYFSGLMAILYGPVHVFLIHATPFRFRARRYRKIVAAEIAAMILFSAAVILSGVDFLLYHLFAMIAGEMLSAFFAVWSVHRGCTPETIALTQRTFWKNRLTYGMYFHLEHHLYPAVPTPKLAELARRIDRAKPELEKRIAF